MSVEDMKRLLQRPTSRPPGRTSFRQQPDDSGGRGGSNHSHPHGHQLARRLPSFNPSAGKQPSSAEDQQVVAQLLMQPFSQRSSGPPTPARSLCRPAQPAQTYFSPGTSRSNLMSPGTARSHPPHLASAPSQQQSGALPGSAAAHRLPGSPGRMTPASSAAAKTATPRPLRSPSPEAARRLFDSPSPVPSPSHAHSQAASRPVSITPDSALWHGEEASPSSQAARRKPPVPPLKIATQSSKPAAVRCFVIRSYAWLHGERRA